MLKIPYQLAPKNTFHNFLIVSVIIPAKFYIGRRAYGIKKPSTELLLFAFHWFQASI